MKKLITLFILTSSFCFSQDSLQVKKPKLSVVELEKIKVVYRGIPNPIIIAVPKNVKSFIVSGNGVSPTNEIGKYIIKPGVGTEVIVKVEMVLQDNSVVIEEHVYQIKGISAPIGTLNDKFSTQGKLEFSIDELKDAIVRIKMVDFVYNVNFEVKSFNLKVGHYPTITVIGNTITTEAFQLLKKAKKKDIIIITEIKSRFYGLNGHVKSPSPIIFKIIK